VVITGLARGNHLGAGSKRQIRGKTSARVVGLSCTKFTRWRHRKWAALVARQHAEGRCTTQGANTMRATPSAPTIGRTGIHWLHNPCRSCSNWADLRCPHHCRPVGLLAVVVRSKQGPRLRGRSRRPISARTKPLDGNKQTASRLSGCRPPPLATCSCEVEATRRFLRPMGPVRWAPGLLGAIVQRARPTSRLLATLWTRDSNPKREDATVFDIEEEGPFDQQHYGARRALGPPARKTGAIRVVDDHDQRPTRTRRSRRRRLQGNRHPGRTPTGDGRYRRIRSGPASASIGVVRGRKRGRRNNQRRRTCPRHLAPTGIATSRRSGQERTLRRRATGSTLRLQRSWLPRPSERRAVVKPRACAPYR
jgi:hypothetical protein